VRNMTLAPLAPIVRKTMLFLLKKARDNQSSGESNRKGREVGTLLRTSRKISEKKRRIRGKMTRVAISPPALERDRTGGDVGGVGRGVAGRGGELGFLTDELGFLTDKMKTSTRNALYYYILAGMLCYVHGI
jgi:hypothetical protein